MKFRDLAGLFYEWGWQIKHEHYVAFSDYLKAMLKRNRVMIVQNSDDIEAVIMFYLTEDYSKVYKKSTWEVVPDDENGTKIYIDKMICKKFTKEIHNTIRNAVTERFPNIEEAMYLRAPFDRAIIKRRQLCTK